MLASLTRRRSSSRTEAVHTNARTIIVFGTKLSLEKVERDRAGSADHCPTPEAVQGTDSARSGGASVGGRRGLPPSSRRRAPSPLTSQLKLCVCKVLISLTLWCSLT